MNAALIRVLFDYNAWANAQVWRCMDSMSDAQFVEDTGYSLGSVRNHLVHMASVDSRWFARVRGQRLPDAFDPQNYTTREEVSRLWSVVYDDLGIVLEHLSDEALQQLITYTARGETFTHEAWKMLLHVLNHSTDHRAQMLWTLHRLGQKTVEQDFIYYLRDELPPRGLLSVDAKILSDLFAYDMYATSTLVSECLAELTDAELDHEFSYSHGTLRAQLAHILIASQYWLGHAYSEQIDNSVGAIFSAMRRLIGQTSDKMLMEPVEYKSGGGLQTANIRWEMLWHLVNHNTDHRAQMLSMLHQLGAPTFEQDIMLYWFYYHLEE